jgi:GH25 family lysozyme M1 (1,4-beta-N-acetylmuramidase)
LTTVKARSNQPIFGSDWSHWNLPIGDLTLSPTAFSILRSSYGLMPDKNFEEYYAALQVYPENLRGAYHYFSSNVDWRTQAYYFLERIQGKDIDWLALDFERYFNNKSSGFAWGAIKWLDLVGKETNKVILLYSNAPVYDTWLYPYVGTRADSHPLWIAQYPYRYPALDWLVNLPVLSNLKPALPKKRNAEWEIWQFSDAQSARVAGLKDPQNNKKSDWNITRRIGFDFIEYVGEPDRWKGLDPIVIGHDDPPIPRNRKELEEYTAIIKAAAYDKGKLAAATAIHDYIEEAYHVRSV